MSDANVQYALTTDEVLIAWDAVKATPINKVTGSTYLKIAVKRKSDGYWYDWDDDTFKTKGSVTTLQQALTEEDSTDAPGVYAYLWDLSSITNAVAEDQYIVVFEDTNSPKDVGYEPRLEIVTGSWHRLAAYEAEYGGAIWVQLSGGTPGSVLGVNGTRSNPVSNLTDAKSLADDLGVRHYKFVGTPTSPPALPEDHSAWLFESGAGAGPTVDMNSKGVSDSVFRGVGITGNGANSSNVRVEDALMYNASNFRGTLIQCTIMGSITFANPGSAGAALILDECLFLVTSAYGTPTIDMDGTVESLIGARLTGTFNLSNANNEPSIVIGLLSADVTLDNINDKGTATIRGVGTLHDQTLANIDFAVDRASLLESDGGVVRRLKALGSISTTKVPVPDIGATDAYNGMRVVVEDAGGSTIEERVIKKYTQSDDGTAEIEVLTAFSFTPALDDPVTIRMPTKEFDQENFFLDNTTYVADGLGKLLTAARLRVFPDGATADAATDGGSSEGEIATYQVTAVAGAQAGEPATYKVVKQ